MSKTVDERVVEMRFDNKHFESNVQTSLSTLDKLKQSLKLTDAAKGLENINSATRGFDLSPLSNGVETVRAKFSALEVMAVTALGNITNSAVNAGKRMISALTIDPIKSGFQEYETQINAVQTILANTESKGSTLQDVNKALDELNTYADKTIYNFTEMTRNIGTFTAAGVDLKTSVSAIKGIANVAAVSGSTSQQASTAMYQLSQALAAGTIKLMDWNSVVNAGMGGQVFQDALKETARVMAKTSSDYSYDVDNLIEKTGSFRESLSEGWLTSEVLTQTLAKFTGDLSEAQLKSMGYTDEQIEKIIKMGKTANDAATKVKTFTQLFDTLKEAAQSGWTETWEIIIGDFGEAKEMLTEISDTIGGMLGRSSDARNKFLSAGLSSGWKQLLDQGIDDEQGYIESIKEVARANGDAFDKMVEDSDSFSDALKKGLQDGTINSNTLSEAVTNLATKMSNMSAEELEASGYTKDNVKNIQDLAAGLRDGSVSMDEFVSKINRPSGRENLIQSLWNSFNHLMEVIAPIKEAFREVFPAASGEQLYALTERIREFTENLTLSAETTDKLKRTFKGLFSILDIVGKAIMAVAKPIAEFVTGGSISSFTDIILSITTAIGDFFTNINESIEAGNSFSIFGDIVKLVLDGIADSISFVSGKFDTFGGVLTILCETIKSIFGGVKTVVSSILEWISDNISIGDVFAGLAGGGIFVFAKKLAGLVDKIKGLFDGFGGGAEKGAGALSEILDSVHSSLESFSQGIKVASLVGIAVAVTLLTSSLRKISEIEPAGIAKGLTAIGIMIKELNIGFNSLGKTLSKYNSKGTIKAAIAMIAMAKAVDILSSAMQKIAKLNWNQILKGLAGIGGLLLELSLAVKLISGSKINLRASVSILALAEACKMLSDSLGKFGSMSWQEITSGLTAMGGALLEFTAVLAILSKVGGGKSLVGSVALLIAVQSLDEISENLERLGNLSWKQIGLGLSAMGGALLEFTAALAILSKVGGFGALLGGTAILVAVQSLDEISENLERLGKLSWEEIGKGLTAMGGALVELSTVSGLLGKLTGLSGLVGAGTILLGVQAIEPLANALQKFGSMTWEEIGRGLTAMGGALTELSIISGGLGWLTGLAGLVGAGTILLAVQGLDDLANALIKFGSMSWEEIDRGLAAMAAALSEVAIGGLINTLSGLGALTIAEVAKPLGDLADSVKKWVDVTVPENLGDQLAKLASGVLSFTFGGAGADAIAEVAAPLGIMADSVKKWVDVVVPENIGTQLASLANGVASFTFAGMGAGSLSAAAAPLGTLADSVKKWADVTVPEGLKDGLTDLSDGVKAFTWAFMGGFSIGVINGPLGTLADTVKKWSDVTIPEGIKDGLKELADGVQAFTWAFVAGWSIDTINTTLSNLADTVKKWNGVNIPEGIKDKLTGFADGINSFKDVDLSNFSSETITTAIGNIKKIISTLGDMSNIQTSGISTLQTALAELGRVSITGLVEALNGGAAQVASAMTSLIASISSAILAGSAMINSSAYTAGMFIGLRMVEGIRSGSVYIPSAITSMMSSVISVLMSRTATFFTAGITLISRLAAGIRSASVIVISSVLAVITSALTMITTAQPRFQAAGLILMVRFVGGLKQGAAAASQAISSIMTSIVNTINGYYQSFYAAGEYLGDGLVEGIRSKEQAAYDAGYALGQAAVQGEKDGQASNSPSKLTKKAGRWLGEGLVIGMEEMGNSVYSAGKDMGSNAVDSISNALSYIPDVINSSDTFNPTIKPVVDMTNVRGSNLQFGASIETYLSKPVDILSQIVSNAQAEINASNQEVINAINGLRQDLNNLYSSDGQEVALYVDSKKLATSLAKPMNRQLNILSKRGAY